MGRKGKKFVYRPCQEINDHINQIVPLLENPSGFNLRVKETKFVNESINELREAVPWESQKHHSVISRYTGNEYAVFDGTNLSDCQAKVKKFLVPSRHQFYSYPPANMSSPAQILQNKDRERAKYLETYCINKKINHNVDEKTSAVVSTKKCITLKDVAAKLSS